MGTMRYWILIILLLGSNSIAGEISNPPALGTYMSYTEADWGVGFELKGSGKAIVTTEYNYEYGKNDKRIEHQKTVNGTWKYQAPNLILTYGAFHDKFIQSQNCVEKRPCFKYAGAIQTSSPKSPLNVKYDFINWTAGPTP